MRGLQQFLGRKYEYQPKNQYEETYAHYPTEIVEKLNSEINAALADPKMKARLVELGGTALPGSAADFGELIAAESEKWGKVIRAAKIKPD